MALNIWEATSGGDLVQVLGDVVGALAPKNFLLPLSPPPKLRNLEGAGATVSWN